MVRPCLVERRLRYLGFVPPESLRVKQRNGCWVLPGPRAERFGLLTSYLAYLVDRAYSPRTVEAYGRTAPAVRQPVPMASLCGLVRYELL